MVLDVHKQVLNLQTSEFWYVLGCIYPAVKPQTAQHPWESSGECSVRLAR